MSEGHESLTVPEFCELADQFQTLQGGESGRRPLSQILKLAEAALKIRGVETAGMSAVEVMRKGGPLVKGFFETLKAGSEMVGSLPPAEEASSEA